MTSTNAVRQYRLFDLSVDQVIVLARLVLASVSLLAIYIDPTQPSRHVAATYALLTCYLLFAIAMASVAFWRPLARPAQLAVHLVDIGTFSLLMHFTEGPTSPFFVLFTFALLSATLIWDGRGVVITTAGLITLLLIVTLADDSLFQVEEAEWSRVVMRNIYLVVAGGMLAYVGSHRERARMRLAKLAAWPPEQPGRSEDPSLIQSFAHAAEVTKARALLVSWKMTDASYVNTSAWVGGKIFNRREVEGSFINLIPQQLVWRPFTLSERGLLDADGKQYHIASDLPAALNENWQARRAAVAPFNSPHFRGHVFVIDPYPFTEELFSLVEIVASRIGTELEHHVLRQKQRELAAAQERVRVAHDIHDRLLQVLTAAALHLKSAAQRASAPMASTLDSVRAILSNEQKRLREFIAHAHSLAQPSDFNVSMWCQAVLAEIENQWGCRTALRIVPSEAAINPQLGAEILLIISEAAANACRHANATRVEVEITVEGACTRLTIRDNGTGFAGINGTIEHDELTRQNLGPASIRKRVVANNGRMTLQTAGSGSVIAIAFGTNDATPA